MGRRCLQTTLALGLSLGFGMGIKSAVADESRFPQLPAPPPGYTWRTFTSIHMAMLVPDGWFVKEEEREGIQGVFISKDSIEQVGRFRTGLTLNVSHDPQPGLPPSETAMHIMEQFRQRSERAWDVEPYWIGPFRGGQGFFTLSTPEGWKLTERVMALGNDATGTFYLAIFESPEAEWEQAKEIGELLLTHLGMDGKF